MDFEVKVTALAKEDIDEAFSFIARDSNANAQLWLAKLLQLVGSIKSLPRRHDLISEAHSLKRELRSIQHYSHRIIYEVNEQTSEVFVVRIYHGARRPLRSKDLK